MNSFPLDLPLINAVLNGTAASLLIAGLLFIQQRRIEAHRACMVAAFVASCLFLVGYLTHKIVVVKGVNTPFRGPEVLLPWYRAMLASHIVLAMAIVPLALVTLFRGWKRQDDRHRKIARWTWPIWMYVSVTGVAIYLALYRIWPGPVSH